MTTTSKNFGIQLIYETKKKICGAEERTEIQIKDIENIFNEITAEKFPNLGKAMGIEVQEAFRIPTIYVQKITPPHHLIL
jgi:hypothetical protein